MVNNFSLLRSLLNHVGVLAIDIRSLRDKRSLPVVFRYHPPQQHANGALPPGRYRFPVLTSV
jgi:hypothetical protein